MARRFARLVVVVAAFVFLSGVARAQTQAPPLQETTGTRALLPLSADVGGTLVRVGKDITEPTQIKYVAPVYPEIARRARVSGVVILEITIDPTGVVSNAKVLRPVALLDQAAVDAVKQWRFTATTVNGVAVPVLMTVAVNFGVADSTPTIAATASPSALPFEINAITTTSAVVSGQPVRVGGDIKEPKKIRSVAPVYPLDAQTAHLQGTVIMEAVLDVYGSVSDVKLLRSAHETLDIAAVNAVRQWKFMPTTVNGMPVSVIMTVTVTFTQYGRE